MGTCCSTPLPDLPLASEETIQRLRDKGHLICLAGPAKDFDGDNQCQTVYVAEYEHGTEITFLFLDEDRPNMCQDCLYDTIRRPLFGRTCDIESIVIINDTVEFPGTYAGEQKWDCKMPEHTTQAVELSKFEKTTQESGECPIIWSNTWNHLMGEKNNNTDLEITYQHPQKADCAKEDKSCKDFVVRVGSRTDVDARFKGLMTTLSTVITEERAAKLGNRISSA